jgi:hypothetical protein
VEYRWNWVYLWSEETSLYLWVIKHDGGVYTSCLVWFLKFPHSVLPPPLFEVLYQSLPVWAEEKQEKFKDISYTNRDTFQVSPKYKPKAAHSMKYVYWHLPCVSASYLLCKDSDDRSQLQIRGFSHFRNYGYVPAVIWHQCIGHAETQACKTRASLSTLFPFDFAQPDRC